MRSVSATLGAEHFAFSPLAGQTVSLIPRASSRCLCCHTLRAEVLRCRLPPMPFMIRIADAVSRRIFDDAMVHISADDYALYMNNADRTRIDYSRDRWVSAHYHLATAYFTRHKEVLRKFLNASHRLFSPRRR